MRQRYLLWELFPSYVVVVALSLAAVTWYATSSLREFHRNEVRAELEARARLVEEQALAGIASGSVQALCGDLGKRSATRITVMLKSGKVVADSDEDPAKMEDHATPDRPEMMAALAGRVGVATRHSATLDQDMMYLAIPLKRGHELVGVVRTAMPLAAIEAALEGVHRKLAWAGLAVGIVAGLLSLFISRRVSKPLEEMKRGAERFARGELDTRLATPATEELAGLAGVMNEMAAQLGERLRTITEQRNQQEAILSSMAEGVLAVDTEERLISINQAAARMLSVDLAEPAGRSIQEAVRNLALQHFVARTLSGSGPTEGEVVLAGDAEAVLQTHGAALRDAQGHRIGAVIVLNDITRLRRLESLRREFVANVSHELRTPITSIKGFVETLLDGALQVPKDAERFLGVIAKQVDRLNSIIEDLLLLSQVEQEEKPQIAREGASVDTLLQGAVQVCELKATEKNVSVRLACEPGITARVNAALIEQAVVNLIDNAIKHSEPGGAVAVEAEQAEEGVVIRVRDHGCGIEKQHLPRLFERFYRVDKARSRKLGGTGLGLSIVKHIAQAHSGRVEVESTPGQGSTFSIHLPK